MRPPLLEGELAAILESGRRQSDEQLTRILDDAQNTLPLWYEAVYGPLSDAIAEVDRDMSELFLDLAFDILWVYLAWRGPFPREDEEATGDFLGELDFDLKAISGSTAMHPTFRDHLQRRFEARVLDRRYPVPLLSHLEVAVERYASFAEDRGGAVSLTVNLLFVLVAWLDEIYHLGGK